VWLLDLRHVVHQTTIQAVCHLADAGVTTCVILSVTVALTSNRHVQLIVSNIETQALRYLNTSNLFTLASCTHGSIRVAGGSSTSQGRVEVCSNNVWGTVCSDGWTQVDANVACRQLGYSNAGICNLHSTVYRLRNRMSSCTYVIKVTSLES